MAGQLDVGAISLNGTDVETTLDAAFAKANAALANTSTTFAGDLTISGNVTVSGYVTAARALVDDDGTKSTGTYTPDPTSGSAYKKIVNGGAFALGVPDVPNNTATTLSLLIVNTTGAGAITTSAWTKVTGDSFTTTTTDEFLCRIEVFDIGGTQYAFLDVVALQ